MHLLPEITTLFTLAVTFCAASHGANALVTERNDLLALEPTVARVNTLQDTKESREVSVPTCPVGFGLCPQAGGGGCCHTGGYCCTNGGFPDRSLNSGSMVHILV